MKPGFEVSEIAGWISGRLVNADRLGSRLSQIRIDRPAPLSIAGADQVAFFFSREYQHELPGAQPGLLITGDAFVALLEAAGLPLWNQSAVIACADPYGAMAILSEHFAHRLSTVVLTGASTATSVDSSAVVHETAHLGAGVSIGPHCVVEAGAVIGAGTRLYPGCYVGPAVEIGSGGILFPGVAVYEWTRIGDRVRLHAGVVLGSDGFGYAPRVDAGLVTDHRKIYHLGRVVVGHDVEIGANSCVDRGTLGETVLGDRVKLDNLVHVGHNARLGRGAVVCGGTCLAGGVQLGEFSYVGGLTGIANRVVVGDRAQVGAVSLLTKDVPAGGTALGNPQRNYREHFRAHATLSRLADRGRAPTGLGSGGQAVSAAADSKNGDSK